MGKGSQDSARRLGLLAVAAALAGGIALTGRRRLAGRFRRRHADRHTCTCGAQYRVHGVDRHRVYWHDGDPMLGDRCVVCEAPLPAGHDAVVV